VKKVIYIVALFCYAVFCRLKTTSHSSLSDGKIFKLAHSLWLMASDLRLDEDIRIFDGILDVLGGSGYFKSINSLSLYHHGCDELEVHVVTASSDPEEWEGLETVLDGFAKSYIGPAKVKICQFNADNYVPAPNPAITTSMNSPAHQ
jgi:hypothetical protein